MKKPRILGALCACIIISLPVGASASLVGDLVGIEYLSSTGAGDGVNTHIVGPGEEGSFFNINPTQYYDFDAYTFDIRSTVNACGMLTCTPTDTVTLSLTDLDFGSPLLGVTVDTNLTGVSVDFGDDYVIFTWNEQAITIGNYLSASFAVPIPAAAWLFGSGLVGLIGIARRKKVA